MRFWDASAVVPLLVDEGGSTEAAELLRADPTIAVWWGTPVECSSALRRREREGSLDEIGARDALRVLGALGEAWSEIQPLDQVRRSALRSLAVHELRSADALQLAAALTWASTDVAESEFVCLDARLRRAAAREGFQVLPVGSR